MSVPVAPTALVVDDSPELRVVMASFLSSLGITVITARDGESGLTMARERKPDLICLDLMLPTVSGLEVCERLKQNPETAAIRVLVVSARTFPQDRVEARRAGADGFVTKPLNRNEFLTQARSLVWQRRLAAVGA